MQQWEYMLVESEIGIDRERDCTHIFLERLNKLGEEGWEAVGVGISQRSFSTRPAVVLLKRSKQS